MPRKEVMGKRVVRSAIGSMPYYVEIVLAHAQMIWWMRHLIKCNCGSGRLKADCTKVNPALKERELLMWQQRIATSRNIVQKYRKNRTWTFAGAAQQLKEVE